MSVTFRTVPAPHQRRTAHPQTCERCRHETRLSASWQTEAVNRISGWCNQGRDYGHGCPEYAEAAIK